MPYWSVGVSSLCWLGAGLLCVPLLLAVGRKSTAFAVLFAEERVDDPEGRTRTPALRALVAGTVLGTELTVLGLWVLLLGRAVDWPGPVLLALLLVLAVATGPAWGTLRRFYAGPPDRPQGGKLSSPARNG